MSAANASHEGAAFQRAFVAIEYFLGRRGEQLLEPLPRPVQPAKDLVQRLGLDDRSLRAQALAKELERIVACLEARKVF
jgi:hypothetical protein